MRSATECHESSVVVVVPCVWGLLLLWAGAEIRQMPSTMRAIENLGGDRWVLGGMLLSK